MSDQWESKPFGDAIGVDALFCDGDWIESKDQDPNGEVRLVQLADILDGEFRQKSERFMTQAKSDELRTTLLEEGDILIARMPDPIGRACIFPGSEQDCVSVVDVAIVRPTQCDPKWLMYCLNSQSVRAEIEERATGSTRKRISRSALAEILIQVPPLPEQKKIVEVLSGIDRRIQADKSLLSKIEDTLQGLRDQTQFGEGRQARIGDLVARITTGTSVSGENRPCNASEHGVLKVSCVSKGEFLPKENKVIVGENKERATMPVRRGMLLMSRANTPELVGACGITNSDYSNLYLPDKVWNLELADTAECSKEWLNNALNSQVGRSKIRDASTGTSDSMRNISQRNFLETEILVPPVATQNIQSNLIESLLTRKMMTAANLEKHLMLKEALSSDLLSGRKRVSI